MRVAVVGSGIIGLGVAYELARRGAAVTVVGDRPAGAGASTNNAGWVVPAECGPVAGPGLIPQALRWMLRSDSPVYIRPSLEPAFVRFMLAMARNCTASAYAAAFAVQARLAEGAMADFDRWVDDGLAFEMHHEGALRAYVDRGELGRAVADLGRYHDAGFEALDLSGDEARAAVPELSDEVVGAIRFPAERHVRPASLIAALAARLADLGVAFVDGAVTGGRLRPAGGVELAGPFGTLTAGAAVVAAGAWSGRVAALFGTSLPVRPGKGYSVDYVAPASTLGMPVMLAEAHCVLTPLDGALRVAGTMEFAGWDERVSATRVGAIRRAPGRYLRAWDPEATALPPTAGLRPMTPDGLPIIGRLRAGPAVFVATGHAMLGLTLAPRTGRLLADMILDGAQPDVLAPFSPRRFGA